MLKLLAATAAIAVVAVAGLQAGYMLSVIHQQNVAQVSAPAGPAKGKILQVDGGGM